MTVTGSSFGWLGITHPGSVVKFKGRFKGLGRGVSVVKIVYLQILGII